MSEINPAEHGCEHPGHRHRKPGTKVSLGCVLKMYKKRFPMLKHMPEPHTSEFEVLRGMGRRHLAEDRE